MSSLSARMVLQNVSLDPQYRNPAHAAVETDASEWVTPANTYTYWTLPHWKFNLELHTAFQTSTAHWANR